MYTARLYSAVVIVLLLCGLGTVTHATAQDNGSSHTVRGTVTDAVEGEALAGVNIQIQGTTRGTATGPDGTYELRAPSARDTLVFTFIGFQRTVVPIDGRTTIDVALQPSVLEGEEVVVTGYQTQRKADVTGSVATVDIEKVQDVTSANLQQSLEGRVAGLNLQTSGTPGGGDAEVRIRGYSTFGDQRPLYIIDGVPTQSGLRTINPRDIESVQVLKDASAASIYGARAQNGVIVITTKKGSPDGELALSFDTYVGAQQRPELPGVTNARQWGKVYWRARNNDGISNIDHPQYDFEPDGNGGVNVTLPEFIDPPNDGNGETIRAANTDWIDESFDTALEQSYNLNLRRSTENANVAASGSYFNQQGIITDTWFDRYTLRVNSDYSFNDRVRIGENVTVDQHNEVRLQPSFTEDILFQHPLVPVYKENGEFAGPTDGLGDRLNPVGIADRNKNNVIRNWRIFGNAFIEVLPIESVTLRSSMGLDYGNTYIRSFQERFNEGTQQRVNNELFNEYRWGLSWTWSNTVEYTDTFAENHNVNVLGGVEAIESRSEFFNSLGREFFLDEDQDYRYLDAAAEIANSAGGGSESTLLSFFGKADYNYADRYLGSFTLRRDASSRLGRVSNNAVFPAFSLGWRISNEPFFSSIDAVDDLKVRFGWGQTGGQSIGDFAAFGAFALSQNFSTYDLTGAQTSTNTGFYRAVIGNQDLGWERSTEYNFGLDLSMWQSRLTIAADYFIKDTEEILLQPPIPAVSGEGSPPFINAGVIDNRGLELELGTTGLVNGLEYSVTGTFAAIRSNVESLANNVDFLQGAEGNRIQPGRAVSEFYGFVADGLFQNQDEVDDHADQPGKGVGRIRYADLNDDGIINDEDRTWIGNPNPDFTYGLNIDLRYKSVDFAVLLQGEQGGDIFNTTRRILDFASGLNFNYGTNTLDAWTPENTDTDIPRLSASDNNNELRVSSYYVEDGSYAKLKTVTLGYTLPQRLATAIRADRVRIYAQGQDLLTFTGYSGTDPEIGVRGAFDLGIDRNFYPNPRKYTLGVNLQF